MSIVQSRPETTQRGGVTGRGFTPGVSGNPGGRPNGLSRRVRELVGEDGGVIAEYMLSVMDNERARTADRIEAGKWIADRGFGKAPLVIDAGVSPEQLLQDYFSKLSLEDLQAMQAILCTGSTMTRSPLAVRSLSERHTTLARSVARFGCRLLTVPDALPISHAA